MRSYPVRPRAVLISAAVAASVLVAGCGEDNGSNEPTAASTPTTPAAATSPTTSSPTSSEPPSGVQQITVTVADGQITPPPDRIEVDEGTTVRIVVTSDEDDEVHVHGYERSADVSAGGTATVELVADQSGLFAVELHHLDKVLFQLQVQ